MVSWVASFVSVILLLSMLALPAIAVVAANQVNSASIIDGQIKTPDLKTGAVTSAKIKNGQVRSNDIALGAVLSGRIANNAVTSAKIRNGTIRTADIAGIRDYKIRYSTKTRHYSLAPAAFRPANNDETFTLPFAGTYLRSGTPGGQMFNAPVQLPDGATVTKLLLVARDNSTSNGQAVLARTKKENFELLALVDTAGAASGSREFKSSAITKPVIDNANYHYYVQLWLKPDGGTLDADGVIITYQVTGP